MTVVGVQRVVTGGQMGASVISDYLFLCRNKCSIRLSKSFSKFSTARFRRIFLFHCLKMIFNDTITSKLFKILLLVFLNVITP